MQMYPSYQHGFKGQRERDRTQMSPSDHHGYKEQQYYAVVEEDYIYKDYYSYNDSSSVMQMMKPDHHSLPKHTYNHNHDQAPAHASYGGAYKNPEKKAHFYEEGRRQEYDTWADNSAHGANRHAHYNGEGMGMNQYHHAAGYGAHQGHYRPHRECPEERKKPSVWDFRGIDD